MSDAPHVIRGVLFDLDDTLNDRGESWRAFADTLDLTPGVDAHALILAADDCGYRPKAELFADLRDRLPWRTPMTAEAIERLWRDRFPAWTVVRPGVLDLLSTLRRRGVRTAVVTNGRQDAQRAKLDHMGVGPLLDVAVISDAVGLRKPDPAVYRLALDRLGVPAAAALFAGDHPESDVAAPARLGMATAWFAHGRPWPAAVPPPDFTVSSFADLAEILSPRVPDAE